MGEGFTVPGTPGVELEFVAPPTGLGLNLEIERAPDSGGSPGSWVALDVVGPIGQVRTRYQDTTVRVGDGLWWYRGRLSGPAVDPGAYATIAAAVTTGWLTPIAYSGDAGESVLGQTEQIRIHCSAFVPNGVLGVLTNGTLRTDTTGVTRKYTAAIERVPVGSTITGMILAGVRNAAGDTCQLDLYAAGLGALSTSLGTATLAASGATSVEANAGALAVSVATDGSYMVELQLKASAAATDAWCEYVVIQFTRNSYRQG